MPWSAKSFQRSGVKSFSYNFPAAKLLGLACIWTNMKTSRDHRKGRCGEGTDICPRSKTWNMTTCDDAEKDIHERKHITFNHIDHTYNYIEHNKKYEIFIKHRESNIRTNDQNMLFTLGLLTIGHPGKSKQKLLPATLSKIVQTAPLHPESERVPPSRHCSQNKK